jgi:hypothetical protein
MMKRDVAVKPGLLVLIFATFFCVLLGVQSQVTRDEFAQVVAAGLGGLIAIMIAPYWALYRGKLPVWFVAALIVALDAWVVWTNTLVNLRTFGHAHWYDFLYMLLFSIPGCSKLILTRRDARKSSQAVAAASGEE